MIGRKKISEEDFNGKEIVWRIKYALINSVNLFSTDDSIEIVPIIDRMLLLLQKNVGVELIPADKHHKPAFSFYERLKSLTIQKQLFQNWEKYHVGIFRFDNKKEFNLYMYYIDDNDENISPLSPEDADVFDQLLYVINTDMGNVEMSKFLRQRLYKSFSAVNSYNHQRAISVTGTFNHKLTKEILDTPFAWDCKNSIREMLDDAFKSFSHNPLIYHSFFKMATFFTVIRYPFERGNLDYTAQILLASHQKRKIEEYLDAPPKNFPYDFSIESFEDPLEASSISLADRCFALDTVQFGLPYQSKNQREGTTRNSQRRILEDEFYGWLMDGKPPATVFYVPIHVNGNSWLAIYKIFGKENLFDNWYLNFEMYNQYSLLIAEKVRLKAKEKFYRLLITALEKAAFSSKGTAEFVTKCTDFLKVLAAFYPYPIPLFNKSGDSISLDEFLVNMRANQFDLKINSLWSGTIEYDKIDSEELVEHIISSCKLVGQALKNKKIEEDIMDASYSISHLIKNKLDEPEAQVKNLVDNLDLLNEMKFINLDRKEYIHLYDKYQVLTRDLRDTLQILDLIPKSITEDGSENEYAVFLKKELFLNTGPLDFIYLVKEVINRKSESSEDLKINIETKLTYCIIQPFIRNNEGLLSTPARFIYLNCVVEIIVNYINSGIGGGITIRKRIDSDGSVGIGFMNRTNTAEEPHSDFREVSRKYGFHGAIGYLKVIFSKIKIGTIKKRVIFIDNQKYFEVCLFLKGIQIVEHE